MVELSSGRSLEYMASVVGTGRHPIVVGWDDGEASADALALARELARAGSGAITVATVVGEKPAGARSAAEERLEAADLNHHRGIALARRVVASSSPGRGLRELADELSAAAIVLGSTHRGVVGRLYPGTVADELIEGGSCPLAVAPRGYARRYGNRIMHVVAAFDGSPESMRAVDAAAELATRAGGSLELVAVLEPPSPSVGPDASYAFTQIVEAKRKGLGEEIARAIETLPPELECEARVVLRGDPALTLAEETAERVDLLVTSSHGYGLLGRALRSGVSSKLVRTAQCPVLVVPGRHG